MKYTRKYFRCLCIRRKYLFICGIYRRNAQIVNEFIVKNAD